MMMNGGSYLSPEVTCEADLLILKPLKSAGSPRDRAVRWRRQHSDASICHFFSALLGPDLEKTLIIHLKLWFFFLLSN